MRQLVYCETGSSVCTVFVNGQVVVDEGKLTTIDLDALCEEATKLGSKAVADNLAARNQADRLRLYFAEMHRRAVAVSLGVNAFPPSR